MSAPVALRSQYGHLFGSSMLPVLEEIFRSELAQHSPKRDMLAKKVTTDRDIWQSTAIHDMDLFAEVAEGSDYSFNRPKQGASKTLQPKKYGLGFSISEEAVEDGKFDFIGDAIRKMAKSARESQEINFFNLINNGTSGTTCADGVAWFSTAHTLPSGLTFRNRLSTYADLSATSLEQALVDFETQFIGDSGIVYNPKAKVLLVHPSNKRYAMELIGSDLKADTADNNMNSLKQDGLMVVASDKITDTDSWALWASPEETGARIVVRKDIETKAAGPDVGFKNDSILYKSRYREISGVNEAYGVMYSAGA
jgi:hypothetical protein